MRRDFEKYKTEYFLTKDWIFPYSEVEKGSKVVLYGAGDVGQAYYEQIRVTGYANIVKWVDKNYDNYQGLGVRIESPELEGVSFDFIVIAVYDLKTAAEIMNDLITSGIPDNKIVWIGKERKTIRGTILERRLLHPIEERISCVFKRRGLDINSEEVISFREKTVREIYDYNKLILPRIVIVLTPVCSLKCKKCNNLIPSYKKPKHPDKEEILNDIDKLMGCVDGVVTVELIGGEPFCYPWLNEVLSKLLKINKIMEIEITTNGTIVPEKKIMQTLRDSKITIRVSKYNEVNYNRDVCEELLKQGVRYETFKDMTWIDSGGTEARKRSVYDNRQIYMKCDAGYDCKTLFKGKIYACARSASLYDLGICEDKNGYVDLYEEGDVKERIRRFYLKEFDSACDYCDYADKWRVIPAGEQK
ncbi:MAG: radical SAM protein [Lachnospiraceae bacterium]|nr:radical SAM protein [Lachnospiraceae bacterium]